MDTMITYITYKYWRQVTYLESIQCGMWVLMIELLLDGRHSIPGDSYSSTIPVKKVLKPKFFQLVGGYQSRVPVAKQQNMI
jgi:hypothetical protein